VVAAMITTTTIRSLLRARPVVTAIAAAARFGDYLARLVPASPVRAFPRGDFFFIW
jgi:hypothetical protein